MPIPQSLETLNAFTFKNKGMLHIVFLILSIITPIFILTVLVICVRTKIKKRKWLWIIFILLGRNVSVELDIG